MEIRTFNTWKLGYTETWANGIEIDEDVTLAIECDNDSDALTAGEIIVNCLMNATRDTYDDNDTPTGTTHVAKVVVNSIEPAQKQVQMIVAGQDE